MKKSLALVFAISAFLFLGCNKPASTASSGIPAKFEDWGVIELSPDTPKHLRFSGTEHVITGTPLADGNIALFIETNSEGLTANMIVPPDVQYACYIGDKSVRLMIRIKPL